MQAPSLSVVESREATASRHNESTYDDYDELSNATLGASSPLGRFEAKSPRSDSKSHLSPLLERGDTRPYAEPPQQLPLNNKNLNGFARGIKTGELPLRADVIPDDEYVDYATYTPETDTEKKARLEAGDVSVVTVAGRTHDRGDQGSDAIDSATYCSNASLHGAGASLEGNAWNIERASVDGQVGSPTRRHADPLSTANLDKHLKELTHGPAPLCVENVVTNIPPIAHDRNESTMAVAPDDAAPSVAIDPSEMDAQSYSEAISPLRNHSMKQSSIGDAMDDMWSTASTRGRDGFHGLGGQGDENPHALSKENLRQLRHQLESGETPLRPEVLAGLGTMARVMAQTNSNMSASTAVEPPATERRSKQRDGATSVGSPIQSPAGMRSPHAVASLGGAMKESDISAVAGMSFHSTVVEVPATEVNERRSVQEREYRKRPFTVSEPVDPSGADVDEDDDGNGVEPDEEEGDAIRGKSSSEDSREGQNESVFNMTEDDGVDDIAEAPVMSRHMRELFKLVQEGQRDQIHLRQQVLEQNSVIERLQNTVKALEAELSALKKH